MSNEITRQNSFVPLPPSSQPPPLRDSIDSWSGSMDGVPVTNVNHDAKKSDLEKMRAILEGRAARRDSLEESSTEGDLPSPPPLPSGWSPVVRRTDSLDSWEVRDVGKDDDSIPPPSPSHDSFSSQRTPTIGASSSGKIIKLSPCGIKHNFSAGSLSGKSPSGRIDFSDHDIKQVTLESSRVEQEKALETLSKTVQACVDPKILPRAAEIRINRAIANLKTANHQVDKRQGGNASRLGTELVIKEAELALENKKASAQGVDRSFNKSAPDKIERERDVLTVTVDKAIEDLREIIIAASKENIPIPEATSRIRHAIGNLQKAEKNFREQSASFEEEVDVLEVTEAIEQEIQMAEEAIATVRRNKEGSVNYVFSVSKNLVEELAVATTPKEKSAANKKIIAEADQKFDSFASNHKLRETLAFVTETAGLADYLGKFIHDPDAKKLIALALRRANEASDTAEKMPDVALRNTKESFQAAMKARAIIDGQYQKIIAKDSGVDVESSEIDG